MILRVFEGSDWASAVERGDFDFDEVPRFGEALAIGDGDRWYAGRVLDVVHRVVDGGTADIAMLIAGVREGRRSDEALPLALLDAVAGLGDPAAPETPLAPDAPDIPPPRGPWG